MNRLASSLAVRAHDAGARIRIAHVGRFLWLACGLLAVASLASPNPLLTAVALLVPALLYTLLWQPGEPPVLAFAATFQWLQAASPVFQADFEGRTITQHPAGQYIEQAAWLSLLVIVVLAVGMSLAVRNMRPLDNRALARLSQQVSLHRLLVLYLVLLVLSTFLNWLAEHAGGLRQPLLALSLVKWIPLFMIVWATLQANRPRAIMIAVGAIEVILGFSGFFSAFKTVLFLYVLVAIGTVLQGARISKVEASVYALVTLLLVCFWQAIKVDYRNYLNQGTGQQVVVVSFPARMQFLARSAITVTPDRMLVAIRDGITRLGYIEYFAYTLRHVPAVIPHQNGALWFDALKHVITPRIFFPDKKIINESMRTSRYTGLRVAGMSQGTSISLGYPAESYVDFGPVGMYVPILLLGVVLGSVYRYFRITTPNLLVGMSMGVTLMLGYAIYFGMSSISLMGGLVTAVLAFILIQKTVADYLWKIVT